MLAAALVIVFQIGIMLTGSYNWFNLLTMLLCLFLFDDQALRRLMPDAFPCARSKRWRHGPDAAPPSLPHLPHSSSCRSE